MARSELTIDAPAAEVFAALADGDHYDRWVVGARRIRAADPEFPRAGTRIHHAVGVGPAEVEDSTEVEAVDTNRRLRLEARVRPIGVAEVEFTLDPAGQGTLVTMNETVRSPLPLRMLNPALAPIIRSRNLATLKKLKAIVESGEYRTP